MASWSPILARRMRSASLSPPPRPPGGRAAIGALHAFTAPRASAATTWPPFGSVHLLKRASARGDRMQLQKPRVYFTGLLRHPCALERVPQRAEAFRLLVIQSYGPPQLRDRQAPLSKTHPAGSEIISTPEQVRKQEEA